MTAKQKDEFASVLHWITNRADYLRNKNAATRPDANQERIAANERTQQSASDLIVTLKTEGAK